MNAYEFLKYFPVKPTSLAQNRIGEAKPNEVRIEETSNIDNTFFYGVFTGLIFTTTVILLTLLKKFRSSKEKTVYRKSFETFLQIPCRKCQCFSNNPYLKCAIRPTTVMSEEAIDCPDYCPRDPESSN